MLTLIKIKLECLFNIRKVDFKTKNIIKDEVSIHQEDT